jgi:hypothetical protein
MDWAGKPTGEASKAMSSYRDKQYGKEDVDGLK